MVGCAISSRTDGRNRAIAIDYLSGGVTYKSVGEKYKLSAQRIRQIVMKQKFRSYFWFQYPLAKEFYHTPVGMLIDPDGIDGSVLQEWTPEQQWKEFEVSDGHC